MITPIEFLKEKIRRFSNQELNLSESNDFVEYPPNEDLGDLAVTLALKVPRKGENDPRITAEKLIEYLQGETNCLRDLSVEGAGFVNCTFTDAYLMEQLEHLLKSDELNFMDLGKNRSLLLEFVSANPTGPLHVGHGRGAVYGDVLGRLLEAHGYEVRREYYVNDTGEQIRRLAESLKLRAKEENDEVKKAKQLSDHHYQGEYVKSIARDSDITPDTDLNDCAQIGIKKILERIFRDLERCGISFDRVTYESEVATQDKLDELIKRLKKEDCVYEEGEALFLRTTENGDDKDRVLIKADGQPTYFANDLVYHHEKYRGNYAKLIDVWGHDHHGYVDRIKAGLSFLGHNPKKLEIELYQLVDLYRSGKPIAMSTREGEFVSLSELVDEVGTDPVRFNFLTKDHDRPLDFDIEVATSEAEENPVYYVQYAHTRMASILREAPDSLRRGTTETDLSDLGHQLLLRALNYRHHLAEATRYRDPHRITHYLMDLARRFHSYYTKHRVIDDSAPERSRLRLKVIRFLKLLFGDLLNLLGVSAPERM